MMHEMFKNAKAVRDDVAEKVKDQDWGIASAVDDIRTKVVEEGYWLRPEGRAVTDDIQPSTMQSFYQSHMPQVEENVGHSLNRDEEGKAPDDNCMRCGQSMDSEICNPDPERVKQIEERGMDL